MWQNLRSLPLDAPPAPALRPISQRFAFIDALRLLAALQMIVGHTLDALLRDELRTGPIFQAWTFARGLTSTAFFSAAGLSFVLAHAAQPGPAGRGRRLRRAGELVLVGFALRAPFGLLWGEPSAEVWAEALQCDVLHCMGAALLLSELVFACVRGRWPRALVSCALGSACFGLAAPLDHAIAASGCSLGSSPLSMRCGAPFPLIPWLGYPLFALAAGVFCVGARPSAELPAGATAEKPWFGRGTAARLAIASALFWVVSWLVRLSGVAQNQRFSPAFGLLKLALVFALASALAFWLDQRALLSSLRRLASQTLFLYGSHVVVLYAGHVGLRALLGHRLALWSALLVAAALCFGGALGSLGYGPLLPALRRRKHGGTPRPQRRPSPPG